MMSREAKRWLDRAWKKISRRVHSKAEWRTDNCVLAFRAYTELERLWIEAIK